MRAGRVSIGSCDARGARHEPVRDGLHDLLDTGHLDFRETNDVNFLLVVLAALQELPVVQKIVELAAVDLVEGDMETELGVRVQKVADVKGGKEIHTRIGAVGGAHHGEGLA